VKTKKKRRRDVIRYEMWLRISDVYPDLTFGAFLKNGCAPWPGAIRGDDEAWWDGAY